MPDRHDVVGLPDEAVRIVRWQRRFVVLALSIIAVFTLAVAVLGLMSFLRVAEQGQDIKRLVSDAAAASRQRQVDERAEKERSAEAVSAALVHIEEIITVATDRNDARAHERYLDLVARLDAIRCAPGTPAPGSPPPVPRQPAPPRAAAPSPERPRSAPRPAPRPAPPQSPAVRPAPPPPPAPNVVEPVPGQEERRGPNSEKGKGKGPPPGRGPR